MPKAAAKRAAEPAGRMACSKCGQRGHNARTCGRKPARTTSEDSDDEDEGAAGGEPDQEEEPVQEILEDFEPRRAERPKLHQALEPSEVRVARAAARLRARRAANPTPQTMHRCTYEDCGEIVAYAKRSQHLWTNHQRAIPTQDASRYFSEAVRT